MVSTKMAAVLAVALLLLSSSVRASAEAVQATITQVRVSDPPTTAPAITNTTEGSSSSHSAVLATEVLGADDNGPLVLVDLARSDQENMTTMSATPPTSDSVPSGFDMKEPYEAVPESFAESTTPPSVDSVPPGFDMNEFDDGSQSLAATQEQGTLVPGYPVIGSAKDNSHRSDYGVVNYDASSATTEDDLSLAASQEQGTLVKGYPVLVSPEDNNQVASFGVETYDAYSATTGDDPSFPASKDEPSLAATQDDGTLVGGYPVIDSSENNQGPGFGVQTYDESASGADSLSAYQEDEYPLEHEDITGGPGVGAVRPYGPFYGQP